MPLSGSAGSRTSSRQMPPRTGRHRVGLASLRPRRGWELHPGVRSDRGLSWAERAADRARDALGSWAFVAATAVVATVGVGVAVGRDGAGPVTALGLALSGAAVVELSLVLVAAARADRTAAEVALHDLESDRHTAATLDELRQEVARLGDDLAWLTARLETSLGTSRQRHATEERER
jgi:uncharacterized membrane protein